MPFILLILLVLTPSVANATDGIFTMRGVTVKKYLPISKATSEIYYQIKAKERISVVSEEAFKKGLRQKTAKEKLHFNNGVFTISNHKLNFKLAYYYQGKLIMEGVYGNINGVRFSASSISFDESKSILRAKRIIFFNKNSLSTKSNYTLSVMDEKFSNYLS